MYLKLCNSILHKKLYCSPRADQTPNHQNENILSNQSSCLTMSAINVKHKQPLKENHIFQNGLIESDKSLFVIFFFLFWSFCLLLVEWHTLQFAATKRNWILKIFLTFWYVCLQSSGKEKFELIYTSMASKMF